MEEILQTLNQVNLCAYKLTEPIVKLVSGNVYCMLISNFYFNFIS